jgi:hypothetical protein
MLLWDLMLSLWRHWDFEELSVLISLLDSLEGFIRNESFACHNDTYDNGATMF